MADEPLRVLGVDTSLRSTGVGVVESKAGRLTAVEFGVIPFAARLAHSACLAGLYSGLADLIRRTQPAAAAIEGVFFSRNLKTTLILGEARGAVIAACAGAGLPVFEYPPRSVKQAVCGHGGAEKLQVRKMLMMRLGLADEPQEDAGDALALALCHLQRKKGHEALGPTPL
jgi:crossover junction endodeoxyribonuclease RuvC